MKPTKKAASKRGKSPDKQPTDLPEQLLLTPTQACQLLSISLRTLWTMTHAKTNPIPHMRIGKSVRYTMDGLHSWVDKQFVKAKQEDARYRYKTAK